MRIRSVSLSVFLVGLAGCTTVNSGNGGQIESYPSPVIEEGWVRDGRPIEFDGHQWYPADDYEVLQDSDVFEIGEYKGVQLFIEKIATKPYERIYTKFAKNRFRYWEQREND